MTDSVEQCRKRFNDLLSEIRGIRLEQGFKDVQEVENEADLRTIQTAVDYGSKEGKSDCSRLNELESISARRRPGEEMREEAEEEDNYRIAMTRQSKGESAIAIESLEDLASEQESAMSISDYLCRESRSPIVTCIENYFEDHEPQDRRTDQRSFYSVKAKKIENNDKISTTSNHEVSHKSEKQIHEQKTEYQRDSDKQQEKVQVIEGTDSIVLKTAQLLVELAESLTRIPNSDFSLGKTIRLFMTGAGISSLVWSNAAQRVATAFNSRLNLFMANEYKVKRFLDAIRAGKHDLILEVLSPLLAKSQPIVQDCRSILLVDVCACLVLSLTDGIVNTTETDLKRLLLQLLCSLTNELKLPAAHAAASGFLFSLPVHLDKLDIQTSSHIPNKKTSSRPVHLCDHKIELRIALLWYLHSATVKIANNTISTYLTQVDAEASLKSILSATSIAKYTSGSPLPVAFYLKYANRPSHSLSRGGKNATIVKEALDYSKDTVQNFSFKGKHEGVQSFVAAFISVGRVMSDDDEGNYEAWISKVGETIMASLNQALNSRTKLLVPDELGLKHRLHTAMKYHSSASVLCSLVGKIVPGSAAASLSSLSKYLIQDWMASVATADMTSLFKCQPDLTLDRLMEIVACKQVKI